MNALIKILKELPQFFSIRNKWEQASKMRSWINEKKGKLSLKFESEVRDEVLKKKKEVERDEKARAAEAGREAAGEAGQIDSAS